MTAWKNFFYFTQTERQGILVLAVLIVIVCSVSALSRHFKNDDEPDSIDKERLEEEYTRFLSSLQEANLPDHRHLTLRSFPKSEAALFPFDPNTADSAAFVRLGLPAWMARNILRYRSKQGKFRRPEDFRKIYGLTDRQYRSLLPYIRIAQETELKDSVQLFTRLKEHKDTLFKYAAGTVIELNGADTAELKKIPGIGSGIARMIVNYRSQLGAFHRIEQLEDIHLKAELLRPWFSIDSRSVRRINVNKASVQRMMSHPYINFYQAKAIVEHRKKNGKINSLKELSLYEEFSPADFERMKPYVCFE
ncbi:ComEA family DNA-binding protein [Bacteroides pyogenes]|uniref:ComEA family DNA-binding protein n=1 Tax=Bacteroides pyogenes TaxID=310300 RepID=UPI0024302779|nr:helix-hairpin-helix domain-containing protein [Bacteroides pyogenes]MCI7071151.1 helix-hairpin-helix domain-containing protein [Bacteroides pyogenes]